MTCPQPLALAEAVSVPDSPGRREVLDHAAACRSCRQALADLMEGELLPLPPHAAGRILRLSRRSARAWIPWSAAAAVLAALLLPWRSEKPVPTGLPKAPHARTLPPAGWDADPSVFGRSGSVTLKPGSHARLQGSELVLLEGSAWVEDPGEPLTLRAGEGTAQIEAGVFLLERVGPASFSWVPEALASEDGARLFVVSGSAKVGDLVVEAGMQIRLDSPEAPAPFAGLPWRGDGWQHLAGMPRRLGGGDHLLGPEPPPESFVWELLFRRSDRSAAAGVTFPAGGQGWLVPLGGPLGEGTGWLRARLELRQGWVRLTAGSYEILRQPAEGLGLRLEPGKPQLGLKSWGGELEVKESRWKEIP